jgi:hypothetical protein
LPLIFTKVISDNAFLNSLRMWLVGHSCRSAQALLTLASPST